MKPLFYTLCLSVSKMFGSIYLLWWLPALGICNTGNFWAISDEVLNRIEGVNYLENKLKHNTCLKDNPIVAQKKFINIH